MAIYLKADGSIGPDAEQWLSDDPQSLQRIRDMIARASLDYPMYAKEISDARGRPLLLVTEVLWPRCPVDGYHVVKDREYVVALHPAAWAYNVVTGLQDTGPSAFCTYPAGW